MKKIIFLSLIFLTSALYAQSVETRLQRTLDSIYNVHPTSIGLMVHVEAPHAEISWSGASGYADKNTKTKIDAEQPALIASSIKTYVAATILCLVEKQKLTLDQSIGSLLTEKTVQLLHTDDYDLEAIQVQHLLSHTSGVANYANQAYIDDKAKRPMYRWTRDAQLTLTVDSYDKLGDPGQQFGYSDANYLLLTEIIEQLAGQPFYDAMHDLLRFDELNIDNTWFPTLQDAPNGAKDLVHQYWGEYDWDSYNLDVSWDLYGGGGIACPTKDLAKFIYHFFNGDIVKTDSIKNLIFTEIPTKQTELYPYYLGLSQDHYHGMNGFGHGGFWSTVMMYFPSIEAAVSVYILNRDQRELRRNVMSAITKVLKREHEMKLNKDEKIKAYLNQINDFSGSILVAHHDEVIEHRAFGLANIEHEVDNSTDTKFNIASISKLITATAALSLCDQELLELNQTVGYYLPDYPNALVRDSVTIHQLLTHTSGIPAFYRDEYLASNKLQYKNTADYLPLFVSKELDFAPGSEYKYGGGGFVVLGLVMEQITGKDYYQVIDEYVFDKAGMKNSMAIGADEIVANKAQGYTSGWGEQEQLTSNVYQISKASPAGGFYSTTNDLFLFSKALHKNVFFSEKMKTTMLSPKVRGYNTHLGYGIDIDQRYDQRIIGHSGGWFGVRTELMNFLASDYTVIVLSNIDDNGKSAASKVIDDLRELIAGSKR